MIEQKEDGTPDEHDPEWTAEKLARSMKFKDLPESLQRTLSSIQTKRNAGVICSVQDASEEQATAKANADSLQE